MEAHLIEHALRIGASGNDGHHPEGWNPKLRATVMGPTPPDAELGWTMYKRDGSSWFEHSVPLPELADEEMHSASLQKWDSGTDITDEGRARFTLRIVNELDGSTSCSTAARSRSRGGRGATTSSESTRVHS